MQNVLFDRNIDVLLRIDACEFDTHDERAVFSELLNCYGVEPALGPHNHQAPYYLGPVVEEANEQVLSPCSYFMVGTVVFHKCTHPFPLQHWPSHPLPLGPEVPESTLGSEQLLSLAVPVVARIRVVMPP